jgi:hypothetical protein
MYCTIEHRVIRGCYVTLCYVMLCVLEWFFGVPMDRRASDL